MCALFANSDDGAVEKKVRRENIRTSEEKKIALMREAVTPHVVDFDSTTWAVCQAIRKVDPENLHQAGVSRERGFHGAHGGNVGAGKNKNCSSEIEDGPEHEVQELREHEHRRQHEEGHEHRHVGEAGQEQLQDASDMMRAEEGEREACGSEDSSSNERDGLEVWFYACIHVHDRLRRHT